MEFILEYTRDHAPGREQITLRPVQSQRWEWGQEEEPPSHVFLQNKGHQGGHEVGDAHHHAGVVGPQPRLLGLTENQGCVEGHGTLSGKLQQEHQSQDHQERVKHSRLQHVLALEATYERSKNDN